MSARYVTDLYIRNSFTDQNRTVRLSLGSSQQLHRAADSKEATAAVAADTEVDTAAWVAEWEAVDVRSSFPTFVPPSFTLL
jgi:hypothetical protein